MSKLKLIPRPDKCTLYHVKNPEEYVGPNVIKVCSYTRYVKISCEKFVQDQYYPHNEEKGSGIADEKTGP